MTYKSIAYIAAASIFLLQVVGASILLTGPRIIGSTQRLYTLAAILIVVPLGVVVAYCVAAPPESVQEKIILASGFVATSAWFIGRQVAASSARIQSEPAGDGDSGQQ